MDDLKAKDFVVKTEDRTRTKKRKHIYINDRLTKDMMTQLNRFFESYIEVPRTQVGKQQTIETLINEEALLLAKFLRNKVQT